MRKLFNHIIFVSIAAFSFNLFVFSNLNQNKAIGVLSHLLDPRVVQADVIPPPDSGADGGGGGCCGCCAGL